MAKRSAILPYTPANPPSDFKQAVRPTWDEFNKIKQALYDLDRPVALSLTASESISITPTIVWDRLFDENVTSEYQLPGNMFNITTGVFTAPQEGLYQITIIIEIPAFAQPGDRLYVATVRSTKHPADGSPDTSFESVTGGNDQTPIRLVVSLLKPANAGDQLWFDLDLTMESYTGSVTVLEVLNIVRIGGYK